MSSRLGRFEIQAEVGHGGFGKVFRAFDPVMNRVVAVKVLTATEDVGSFTRFKNEATAAGNLDHPNIVTVYEFGQEGKTPYIVMEFLDGEDLQHVIKADKPLSLYQKIRIMDQVADGLHCAHRNGVLHRDVKPANVMVRKDGSVKVMDFGIARLMRDTSTRLTQQGYLIGTVVYMAPELFAGAEFEVDALCDIWSYGVILYELLAGKNPFQTGSMQSEMYRIMNQEPEPLAPINCPAELQAVVNKLLCRQREYRYQTLEDTRFDLQPILKNLEKAEAERLLSDAQQLMFRQQWSEALAAAREARRMDPQNGTARIIFERAQTELQRLNVRPRIDDLLRRSNDVAEQRKISEAIDLLDSARKLDTANEKVLNRLQELRALKVRLEEAAKLVNEAGREFLDKRLTAAFEHVSEAVSLDPDNAEARRLLESIQSEIQAREAGRAIEEEIRRARGLIAIDDLDGAVKTLKATESQYPGRAETRDLLAKLAQLISERERRRDFSRRLENAKDLVRNARFAEAVKELEQLLSSFPNEVEATDLLSYARQELRAKQRSEDVKRIADEAAEFNRTQRFADAIRIIEEGLKKYPDDLPLTRLLRSTHADLQAFERERALEKGLQRCEVLRQSQQWQDALDLLARLASDNQNNRELLDLEAKVRQEKNLAERTAAVRSAVKEAEGLLRAGKPDSAVSVIEAALLAVGAERELTAVLDKAKTAQQAERERQYIDSEIKHAKGFEQRGDITTSLKIIDDALLRYPKSQELLQVRGRLTADRERAHHEQKISEQAAAIEAALNRKQWPQVQEQLEAATKLFPAEGVFSRLGEELRRRESEEINQLVGEGHRLLDAGQIAEAEQFCLAKLREHRETAEVKSLILAIQEEKRRRREAKKTRFVAECLRTAQDREQKGDLAGALETLQQALQRYPQEPGLMAARQRVSGSLAVAKQRQVFAQIEQALAGSNWEQGLALLEQARAEYSNSPAMVALQDKALDQRSAFLDRAATAIRGKLGENKLDDARTLFAQNLARYQDQSIVRAVAAEIAASESRRSEEEKRRGSISGSLKESALCELRGDLARALAIVQKALDTYPDEPQLSFARNRISAALNKAERERELATYTAAVRKELDRGNWDAALKKLEEGRNSFPENPPELAGLEQQARKLREREIQTLIDRANEYLKLGNPADAEKILNKPLAQFSGEPAVLALANALKEARWRDTAIQTARTHTAARRFDEAEAAINQLAARRPRDPEEGPLRASLEAAREQDRKDKLYRTGRAEGDQLLRNRQYAEAVARFEYLLTQFPGDRQLQRDLDGAIAAEQRSRRTTEDKTLPLAPPAPRRRGWIYGIAGIALAGVAGLVYWMTGSSSIDVSPGAVNFVTQARTSSEARITVTSSSNVPVPRPGADWITVTRGSSSEGKTEFLVRASAANLAPGEYHTDLTFPSNKKLHIDLVVKAAGDFSAHFDVQPASLDFPYSAGSIPAQKLLVDSSSDIPDPKPSVGWITFTRSNLGPHKAEFSVRVSAHGLPPGSNSAELIFPDKRVPVGLTVPGQTAETPLEVHPLSLAFSDVPRIVRQTVSASGPQAIPDPTPTEKWLHFTRRNIGAGKAEFIVEPSADGLQAGKTYNALLVFPQQKSVRIALTLAPKALPSLPTQQQLDVQPTELSFVYKRVTAPAPQIITASGPSDIEDPRFNAGWLAVLPSPPAQATKVRFLVQVVSPEKLAPGDYHEELTFPQHQKKVRVNLEVFDPPDRYCLAQGSSNWIAGAENHTEELVIKGSHVLKGSGTVHPGLPTCAIVVDSAKLPPGVTVADNPSQENNFTLRLRNSGGPLPTFPIPWTKK